MKKLVLIFILIVGLVIILLLGFWQLVEYKYPFWPKDYSLFAYLISIFNVIFGAGLLFSIYQWIQDRKYKLEDNFKTQFDEFIEKLYPTLSNIELSHLGIDPFVLENFSGLKIFEENNQLYIGAQFKNNYEKFDLSKSYIQIEKFLIQHYFFVHFLEINKDLIESNKLLLIYVKNSLKIYKNLIFFYSLFILNYINSKNILTHNSSSLEKKTKYLVLNYKDNFEFIINLNKKAETIKGFL